MSTDMDSSRDGEVKPQNMNKAYQYGSIDTLITTTSAADDSQCRENENDEAQHYTDDLCVISGGDDNDEYTSLTNSDNSMSPLTPFSLKAQKPLNRNGSPSQWRTLRWILYCIVVFWFVMTYSYYSSRLTSDGPISNKEEYEYIVIGAGPSGLVAGVNLARRLETEALLSNSIPPKVLILESGTKSQSAVMNNMNSNSRHAAKVKDPIAVQSQSQTLDKFDVPLMWSSLSRKDAGDKGLSEYLSHHWPVEILGRAVGGSGIHNAMINVRALPEDFERWNVTGWGAKDILPYFDSLESYDSSAPIPKLWDDSDHSPPSSNRGKHGPLNTLLSTGTKSPLANDFISSALAAGLPLASLGFNDPDARKRIGIGYYEFNIRNGIRDSVAKAMLSPEGKYAHVPRNLVVKTDATVDKVLFDDCNNDRSGDANSFECVPRSKGVRYFSSSSGTFKEVFLRQTPKETRKRKSRRMPEIVLAAGAILTPQILANSGIHHNGPIVDSDKVGKNLQDHPVIGVAFPMKESLSEAVASYFNLADQSEAFETYLESYHLQNKHSAHIRRLEADSIQKETMSTNLTHFANPEVYGTAGFSVGGFLRSPFPESQSDANASHVPDIQLTFFPHTQEPHFIQRQNSTASSRIRSILVTVTLLRPEAIYNLNLNLPRNNKDDHTSHLSSHVSPPPRKQFENMFRFHVPDIEGGKLSELDLKRLTWGVDQVRKIFSTSPLSINVGKEQYPGAQYDGIELEKFIQQHIMRNSHWSGSTKMGNDDDEDCVVDSQLNVKGVSGLRIVDAGVMPYIPNGNTHSTTCAIALKGVDLILR